MGHFPAAFDREDCRQEPSIGHAIQLVCRARA